MPFEQPWRTVFQPGDLIFGYASSITQWIIDHAKEGASDNCKINVLETDISQAKSSTVPGAQSFVQTLGSHLKYSLVVSDEAMGRSKGFSGNMNRSWRLKSKGALYWATRVADKHVHFVLDGIPMSDVVLKNHNQGPPHGRDLPAGKAQSSDAATKTRTITHAELRWIYRNKVFPEVRQHIQFWFNKACCEPPWRTDPGMWLQYKPTNSVSTPGWENELD